MTTPAFLNKLRTLERDDGWLLPCPDAHASSGFAVLVKADEHAGRYRFTCLEATNGDVCGRERDLVRLLGLTEAEVRISDMARAVVWLDAYDMKQVEWAETPLLQIAFTLLAGRPGIGKGALVARWVARCTNGTMYGKPRPAILLSTEDDLEVDLGPRIEAAGGDRSLVAVPPQTFSLPRDIDWLREYVEQINESGRGDVGFIGIDPLSNHTGAANTDREAEVRAALMPLASLVHELAIPTVGVRHLSTKESKGGALAKVLGSTAWIGVPRVVLGAVRDTSDPALVHVAPIKGNRRPAGESGVRFKLESHTLEGFTESVVYAVEDGTSDVDLDAHLAGEQSDSRSGQARELILETLREAGGSMESDTLAATVAQATGLNARTVNNLRTELGNEGLLRSKPERDTTGTAKRWHVHLTEAAKLPPSRGGTGSRDVVCSSRDLAATTSLDHDFTTSREHEPDEDRWDLAHIAETLAEGAT